MAVVASLSHYTVLFTLAALAFPHETLATHFTVFQDIAHTPYVALVGIVIVGFSSALGSFIGGARVLQALARDRVFPFLGCFGRGFGKGDEPRLAILFIGGLSVGAGGRVERR